MRLRSPGSRCLVTAAAVAACGILSAAWTSAAGDGPTTSQLVGAAKVAIAGATAALLVWGVRLRQAGRDRHHRRLRDALLLLLGLLGLLAWSNFFQFHYLRGIAHAHDLFHYTLGAKYFDELRYTRLYPCTTVADAEAGLGAIAARRPIRNLETYRMERGATALRRPADCTRHFSPERWESFRHDVGWFRERLDEPSWRAILADHGYNPSPVWTAVGRVFLADAPLDWQGLTRLLWIDPLLLAAMWLAVWGAFGWRTACVALVFFGTNLPGDFRWTGGAFLRDGWIATLVIGICLLRRGWMGSAGAVMTTGALLRIFPGLAIAGVALAAACAMRRRHSLALSREHARFAAGSAAAALILIAFSFATAGGTTAWREFAANMALHSRTAFATDVGLASALAYDYDTPLERRMRPAGAVPNASAEAFATTYAGRRWIHAAVVLAYLWLLTRAVSRRSDADDAALAAGAIVLLTTFSNYYFAVFLGFALLERGGGVVGAGLCALAALTWCIAWLSGSFEQTYAWISLASVAFVLWATARCGRTAVEDGTDESYLRLRAI